MEFASSILSSILSKIGESLVDSSIHQANYLLRFKNYVDDLKREDENLRSTQNRVQHDVERAKRNAEEIEKDVEKWLMDVQNVLEEIQRLEDEMQVKKTFLCGQCPNWGWRYKLSKRAVKKMIEMAKLRESGNFSRVSHSTTLPGVQGPKNFISFKPTEYALSQIMEALKNDKINMVGLYGMGGVGKTTLAKVVGKEAKEKKLFDVVVMVTVTQNPDFKNIQCQIAESLGLELKEETIEVRAQRVCKRMKDEKTILIILDDVWKKLNLTTIGIPFGDDHKGCTILLTTRQQQVCSSMGCQSRIQLDILNEEEGLILLRKHAGNNVEVSEEFFEEMKTLKVASLRWVDLSVKSLQFLTNLVTLQLIECRVSDISSIKKLAQVEILSLKGSWIVELPEELGKLSKLRMLDITDCGNLKRIHVNVIPRLSRLEELYIGQNSFTAWEVEGTSAEGSNVNASLSELNKLYCLTILTLYINVEPCLPKDFVWSKKLLRYSIAVNSRHIKGSYPKSRLLKIWSFKALYENVEYLKLVGIKGCCRNMVPSIDETGLNELKSLSLWSFDELECIIDMTQQQDVTSTAFSNLRPPRGFLENLETLELEELRVCNCGSLEHIVEIKEVEENVGGGGGNDVIFPKLRKLQLGGLENFINFFDSENYSSTWPALQELSLYLPLNSTISFAASTNILQTSKEVLKLFHLEELECLCKVSTHLLSLPNLKNLVVERCDRLRHMFSPSLARNFMQLEELIIEDCEELEQIIIEDDAAEYNQTLSKDHLQWPLLFPNLSSIDIQGCDKLKSMFPVSMAHLLSLQNLTSLKLDTCHGLTHLFSSTLARNLLRLESIVISFCGELEQIIVEDHTKDDHVQLGLFPNLSSISIKGCGKLKSLFPDVTIARSGLQKLRTLIVENSSQLEELFGHKGEADMTSDDREIVLPQLKELTLRELESLVNFCPVGYHFIFPSLSGLVVLKCPKITTRFSVDQNGSVHAETKAPQTGKEDVDMEQSPPETTKEIECRSLYSLQIQLPPYIGK
ncbi:hypothetical protein EZV62_008201 [Acer yangbiense]|uniref:Uncharacterized protein n=1 Tax=Acer yangbiense TaxID=1000413 RepID=A0A5C7IET2_9ROSI|nr:hypothetical protein EZV62_008201 [Acer yangbiense]